MPLGARPMPAMATLLCALLVALLAGEMRARAMSVPACAEIPSDSKGAVKVLRYWSGHTNAQLV